MAEAAIAGEGPHPGDVLGQRRDLRHVVPGVEEAFEEWAALPGQLVGASPSGLLREFVFQPGRQARGPAAYRDEVRLPAARLAEQAEQGLGELRNVGVESSLGPLRAEVAVAEQRRYRGEGPIVFGQPQRLQQERY